MEGQISASIKEPAPILVEGAGLLGWIWKLQRVFFLVQRAFLISDLIQDARHLGNGYAVIGDRHALQLSLGHPG